MRFMLLSPSLAFLMWMIQGLKPTIPSLQVSMLREGLVGDRLIDYI